MMQQSDTTVIHEYALVSMKRRQLNGYAPGTQDTVCERESVCERERL